MAVDRAFDCGWLVMMMIFIDPTEAVPMQVCQAVNCNGKAIHRLPAAGQLALP